MCEREGEKKADSLITAAAFWSQRDPERSIKDICVSLGSSKSAGAMDCVREE